LTAGIFLACCVVLICAKLYGDARRVRLQKQSTVPAEFPSAPRQAVLVHLSLSNEDFGTPDERERSHRFQDELVGILEAQHLGELDGDEWGGGECTIYLFGPDAQALWKGIEPTVRGAQWPHSTSVTLRFGEPGTAEQNFPVAGPLRH